MISRCKFVISGYREYVPPKPIIGGVWMRYKLNADLIISNKLKTLLQVNRFLASEETREILPPIINQLSSREEDKIKFRYEEDEIEEVQFLDVLMMKILLLNWNNNG